MARPRRSAAGSNPAMAQSTSADRRRSCPTHDTAAPIQPSEPDDDLPPLTRTRSFKGVVIPSRARLRESEMANKSTSGSRRVSSTSSNLSSVNSASPFTADNSEVDTAATSAITTPAEPVSNSKRIFPKGHIFENPFASKGKGKRTKSDADLDEDAALAQALQAEEYAEEDAEETSKSKFKRRRIIAPDSEVEESIMSESSEDIPLASTSRSKSKTMKPSTPARPGRKARTSAQKSLKKTLGAIADSDDGEDSDLSEFVEYDNDNDTSMNGVRHFAGVSEDESDADSDDDDDAAAAFDWAADTGNGESIRDRWERRKRVNRAQRERKKLEKSHPEIKTMWDELDALPRIKPEEASQPASISRKLKSFQLEGLNWMIKQEQTKWKGGLLGDEMGMGKTIQAVSLIMSDYPTKPHKPTLVVVPPVALMQWTNEIQDYTSGQLKVLLYHGQNAKAKQMDVKELKSYDVIMISYSGLESTYRKQEKGWTRKDKIVKETSAIHSIDFHRLILDEAHSIKSRTAGVAKACFALKSTYKWCLSGTPVQNRIGEFFSLLRFLGVTPFANYFCKDCDCAKIDWHKTPDYRCVGCGHRTLQHVSVFNQEILNPIVSGDTDEQRKLGLKKLRMLTDHIMLRRMKRDQTASMELPPKEVVVHNEFFGEIERDFSNSIMSNTARTFDTYVSRGVMLNNYANIFGLIMQMRQVADHPDLLLKKHAEVGQNVLICNICDEPAEEAIRSRCKHEFCRVCAKDYVRTCEASGAKPDCPRCHIVSSPQYLHKQH